MLQWEGCLLHVRYEQREDVLLRQERSATASRRLLNHHSSSDTLTHSHSVQKRKHIHRDTNSLSTWLLTFLRCSEVNSLNRLNKPVQLAVVNLQLKNMIFGRIASFSHIAAGGCRKMKVFIAATVNLFKWSQLQPLKKAEHLNFRSPKWQSSTLWLKSKTNGNWWLGSSCSLNLHRCFWSWRSSSCTSDDKKMKRLHIRTWWLMQMDVLSRYVTVAVKSLWTASSVWAAT